MRRRRSARQTGRPASVFARTALTGRCFRRQAFNFPARSSWNSAPAPAPRGQRPPRRGGCQRFRGWMLRTAGRFHARGGCPMRGIKRNHGKQPRPPGRAAPQGCRCTVLQPAFWQQGHVPPPAAGTPVPAYGRSFSWVIGQERVFRSVITSSGPASPTSSGDCGSCRPALAAASRGLDVA